MELAGKEVAFEATAAGAVKWRVVDHAEVAQHAKGAPFWLVCARNLCSVLTAPWLHHMPPTVSATHACNHLASESTCFAMRKTLCMAVLLLSPSPA